MKQATRLVVSLAIILAVFSLGVQRTSPESDADHSPWCYFETFESMEAYRASTMHPPSVLLRTDGFSVDVYIKCSM